MLIKNLWGKIHLFCGNHGEDETIEMTIHEGSDTMKTAFYSCPKYYPDNREKDERACVNHISVMDFEKMLNHISDEIGKGIKNGEEIDLKGYKWKDRYIEYKVIRFEEEYIGVLCLNKKSIK